MRAWKLIGAGVTLGAVWAATATAQVPQFGFEIKDVQVSVSTSTDAESAAGIWIGVECGQVDEALRTQLGLAADQGLLVLEVVPDSPAGKAGLKRHDVLLQAGENKLTEVRNLVEAVSAAGKKELKLKFMRAGKEETVSIQPSQRPAGFRWNVTVVPEQDQKVMRQLQDWVKQLQPGQKPLPPMALHMFHPGVVMSTGPGVDVALPEGMTVTVTKQGRNPAKIAVQQGDKHWEVTPDKLDELPIEVRQHVAGFIGRPFQVPVNVIGGDTKSGRGEIVEQLSVPMKRNPAPIAVDQQMRELQERLEKQLLELNRRVEQMQKRLEGNEQPGAKERSKL